MMMQHAAMQTDNDGSDILTSMAAKAAEIADRLDRALDEQNTLGPVTIDRTDAVYAVAALRTSVENLTSKAA